MAKGNVGKGKAQKRNELERKRDERSRRKALKKEREIKEYLENDENLVSFKNQLEASGLKIKDILGDGNCLFRALGDQLNGDHTSHTHHRRNTVQYMKNHREDFEPFMEDGTTFEKHLSELSKLGTYGGNDSIVAFARNNGVDIVIHQLNNPRWVIHGSEYSNSAQKTELHLAYHNGEHYSSVRRLADPDDGPAWQYNQKQDLSKDKLKESVNKAKKKKPKKDSDKSNAAQERGNSFMHEAFQFVMENTGCQDLELIDQTLKANNYDVNASIVEILQVMCVLEDQDIADGAKAACANDESIPTERDGVVDRRAIWNEGMDGTSEECNSDATCRTKIDNNTNDRTVYTEDTPKVKTNIRDESEGELRESNSIERTENRLPFGARPKENISKKSRNKAPHLTNRQRKEQARKEKKTRREERRKHEQDQQKESQMVEQNDLNAIVADLGAVSI